jgi:flavocytochrome c
MTTSNASLQEPELHIPQPVASDTSPASLHPTNTDSGTGSTNTDVVTVSNDPIQVQAVLPTPLPDVVIVVGAGLAGLTVALTVLDRGGTTTVVLIEKESVVGGNSIKASSGINACHSDATNALSSFYHDTLQSAGRAAQPERISMLVQNSGEAIDWLRNRIQIPLDSICQLGGHSVARTYRPSQGSVGFSIISGLRHAIAAYGDRCSILVNAQVTSLIEDAAHNRVIGVTVTVKDTTNTTTSTTGATTNLDRHIYGTAVVLTTGGYAANGNAILQHYRPDLAELPATAGSFSRGDGITLATRLGAALVDMDKIQLHPTGFIDPQDPGCSSKVLAAEFLRGVGGILLNRQGRRFCNEMGARDYVVEKMQLEPEPKVFFLVLSTAAAEEANTHVEFYVKRGLLKTFQGVQNLQDWMGITSNILRETLTCYIEDAALDKDCFGRLSFGHLPSKDLDREVFYAGTVTPVLHYCMGGIAITTKGAVMRNDSVIPGLYAVGEVTGGLHGDNRLGGNSLLECVVFGKAIGRELPLRGTCPL